MSEARVKVSLNDVGTLEIEGTEVFVSAELEKFRESMRAEKPAAPAEAPAAPAEADGQHREASGVRHR